MSKQRVVFTRREHILEYLDVSEHIYSNFVQLGMPVLILNGRCYAHKDNIDAFFKHITNVSAKNTKEAKLDEVEGEPQITVKNGGSKK